MKQLTKEELDTMAWMDEAGIVLDADLMEMASRNWRNRNERYREERKREEFGAFIGLINVAKFYFCCYLIVKVVQLGVRAIR